MSKEEEELLNRLKNSDDPDDKELYEKLKDLDLKDREDIRLYYALQVLHRRKMKRKANKQVQNEKAE